MSTKPSNIGRWIGAIITAIVLVAVSFVGFRAFNAHAHANAEPQSGAQSPQSDTAAQSGTQSGDAPLNPRSRHPLTSQNPLPRLTSTRAAKLVPKRHHSGTSTSGHMRSIPETQKTS